MYWSRIFDEINKPNTRLVYLAVGSAMKDYHQITPENNQQYPCFLDKFSGNKVVILIDPELEEPLAVERFFTDQSRSLMMTDLAFGISGEVSSRIFVGDDVTIFAINSRFYFEVEGWMDSKTRKIAEDNIAVVLRLIVACLDKSTRMKLIIQDYSGRDLTNFNIGLLSIFEREKLLQDVLIDVSQKDGGCFIELNPDLAPVDSQGNFIQDKFSTLLELRGRESKNFTDIYRERLDSISYPIGWCYKGLRESKDFQIFGEDKIKKLVCIYDIEYNDLNKDPEYLQEVFARIFHAVFKDAVVSIEGDVGICDYVWTNILNRSIVLEVISGLKSIV